MTAAELAFQHEAMLYRGLGGFLAGAMSFLREGIAAGESAMAAVGAAKIVALQKELGRDAEHVHFADMAEVGRNPARIIPAWQRFVDLNLRLGRPVRVIGEPIWAGRSAAELIECQAHETLLNVAFAESPNWSLLCSYDVGALPPEVVDEAWRSHPIIVTEGVRSASDRYIAPHPSPARLDDPLPPPPADADEYTFGPAPSVLRLVRMRVRLFARRTGLDAASADNMVMAASELATNSLRHGGGRGTMRMWATGGTMICEIADSGHITGPALLGRQMPSVRQDGGRGLWLANQLCDLVQIRSGATGTTIRLHMSSATAETPAPAV